MSAIRMTTPLRTDEDLQAAYTMGLLRKSELVDGMYYSGLCRNAQIARWHAGTQCFVHVRTKFGSTFYETIRHPEDERNFDVFRALRQVEPAEHEKLDDERFERTATGGLRG